MTIKDYKISIATSFFLHVFIFFLFSITTVNNIILLVFCSVFFLMTIIFGYVQMVTINNFKKFSPLVLLLSILFILIFCYLLYPFIFSTLGLSIFLCKAYISIESMIFTYVVLYGIL